MGVTETRNLDHEPAATHTQGDPQGVQLVRGRTRHHARQLRSQQTCPGYGETRHNEQRHQRHEEAVGQRLTMGSPPSSARTAGGSLRASMPGEISTPQSESRLVVARRSTLSRNREARQALIAASALAALRECTRELGHPPTAAAYERWRRPAVLVTVPENGGQQTLAPDASTVRRMHGTWEAVRQAKL